MIDMRKFALGYLANEIDSADSMDIPCKASTMDEWKENAINIIVCEDLIQMIDEQGIDPFDAVAEMQTKMMIYHKTTNKQKNKDQFLMAYHMCTWLMDIFTEEDWLQNECHEGNISDNWVSGGR